jgi:hypothetical protein
VRARVRAAAGDAAGADAAAREALARVRRARGATARLRRAALTTAAEARLAAGGWPRVPGRAARRADGRLLAALLSAHRRLATRTGHDRTALAAAAALARAAGGAGAGRAAALVDRYLRGERRSLGAPAGAFAAYAAAGPAGAGA